jgi:protein-L-isoaspartate(D-aspartate) O-methyltransferase
MTEAAGELEERSARARAAMIEALSGRGAVSDPAVLEAMGRVPREAFVPRFWTLPPPLQAGTPAHVRQWWVEDDDEGAAAVDLVYDVDRALGIRGDPRVSDPTAGARVTSTASAPRIVGSMLELLDLAPGMSVLEIGAGSGYNAALLREIVGSQGSVVSVDIDAALVAETANRLEAAGYGDVHVVAADGYFGLPQRAPFDRVVATVGCIDVAPAWLDQLAPDGFCLVPLQHDGWHPLTRIARGEAGITGLVVGRSGFVAIRGHQAGRSPWPHAAPLGPDPEAEWADLPAGLAADLRPEEGREAIGGRRMWDLAYLLALEDRRTASLLSLADDGSTAAIDPGRGQIGWAGPGGPSMRARLLEVAQRWVTLGRPSLGDYTGAFTPLATAAPEQDPAVAQWIVDRVDFRQTVSLGMGA